MIFLGERERAAKIIRKLKAKYPNTRYYLNFSSPLELLAATILSAQARDELVNSVTLKLFKKYKSAPDYANLPVSQLEKDIKRVNFFRNKAKAIQNACKMLIKQYGGKVPDTMEELIQLPGIGRKSANAILINAFNKVEGIVVDTHVIRLSLRLGFTRDYDPEKIERDLMKLIPKINWKPFPWLMKDHGRAICVPKRPKCPECVVNELCPKVGV